MRIRFLLPVYLQAHAALAVLHKPLHAVNSDIVPGKFIVEFEPKQEGTGYAHQYAETFATYVRESTSFVATPFFHYDKPKIFVGAAVHLSPQSGTSLDGHASPALLAKLRGGPNVRQVWHSRYVTRTSPVARKYSAKSSIVQDLRFVSRGLSFDVQARQVHSNSTNSNVPAHDATGISIQHEQGNLGAGVKVCIIDTAIDYSHPSLNSGKPAGTPCLGDSCQIEGGYDWVGPSTKNDTYLPAALTLDAVRQHPLSCEHGTHVAGLAAANDGTYPGAAPSAKIRSYSVFGCLDSVESPEDKQQDSIIIQAIIKASEDNCDVINASLGGSDWPNEVLTIVASRVSQDGNTFVASAGNSGSLGLNTAECPGCGDDVLSVGASQDDVIPAITLAFDPQLQDGTKELFAYSATLWTWNTTIGNLPLVFLPNASSNDLPASACEKPDTTADLRNALVVVSPGDCSRDDQIATLTDANVSYALVAIASPKAIEQVHQDETGPKIGALELADVKKLYAAWKQDPKIAVSVNPKDPLHFVSLPSPRAKEVAWFSSLGPTAAGSLKPDVLAPGSKIVSSFPLPILYANIAGTSMSSPIAAGAVALFKAAKGKKIPLDTIRKSLVQSAQPVPRLAGGDGKLQSVFFQGGGLINVTAAIELTTLVEPYRLSLGDSTSRNGNIKQTLTVTNVGTAEQSYALSHVAAQSVLALESGGTHVLTDGTDNLWSSEPDADSAEATLVFTPAAFALAPGASQEVDVAIVAPADNPRLLAFSGYVKVASDQPSGSSTVPYGGFAGSFSGVPALTLVKDEDGDQFPGLYNGSSRALVSSDNTTWDLAGEEGVLPAVSYILTTPSESIVCDIVAANISYKATVPVDVASNPAPMTPIMSSNLKFLDIPVALRLYNLTYEVRSFSGDQLSCFAIANGLNPMTGEDAVLAPGNYRLLLRVHRWAGKDFDLDSSYDSYLSHSFIFASKGSDKSVTPKPSAQSSPASSPVE